MTDTTLTPKSDDSSGASGEPDGKNNQDKTSDLVSRSELEEAIRTRQAAKDKLRKQEEKYESEMASLKADLDKFRESHKAFEDHKRKLEEDEAAKRGDIEKIRESARSREQELLSQIDALNARLSEQVSSKDAEIATLRDKYLLENELLRSFGEFTVDPQNVLLLYRSKFKLEEDKHGQLVPVVTDSALDVRTYIERELEASNRTYLLKSKRAPGTGTEPASAKGTTASNGAMLTKEQISKLPDAGASYFRGNTDAAREVLRGVKLRG